MEEGFVAIHRAVTNSFTWSRFVAKVDVEVFNFTALGFVLVFHFLFLIRQRFFPCVQRDEIVEKVSNYI